MSAKRMLILGGLMLSITLVTSSLMAQTIGERDRPAMKIVEKAIESVSIELSADRAGQVSRVLAKPCSNCLSRSFSVSPDFRLFLGRNPLTEKALSKWNNSPGTVLFDAETGIANRVILFKPLREERL